MDESIAPLLKNKHEFWTIDVHHCLVNINVTNIRFLCAYCPMYIISMVV